MCEKENLLFFMKSSSDESFLGNKSLRPEELRQEFLWDKD